MENDIFVFTSVHLESCTAHDHDSRLAGALAEVSLCCLTLPSLFDAGDSTLALCLAFSLKTLSTSFWLLWDRSASALSALSPALSLPKSTFSLFCWGSCSGGSTCGLMFSWSRRVEPASRSPIKHKASNWKHAQFNLSCCLCLSFFSGATCLTWSSPWRLVLALRVVRAFTILNKGKVLEP